MGKLIDTDKLKDITEYCILANVPADAENTMEEKWNDWFQTVIDRAQPVEAIPKADMVAMLEDLKQDLIAESYGIELDCTDYVVNVADIDKIIQQKINALKAENEDN